MSNENNIKKVFAVLLSIIFLIGIIVLCIFEHDLPKNIRALDKYPKLDITTPALLFPAISLLLLAYTNKFLVLAQLIRELHFKYKQVQDGTILRQIDNLRKRVNLIKNMQFLGVFSFFLCVFCMLLIFFEKNLMANLVFGCSLFLLMFSLALSIREIGISVDALNLHLGDLENEKINSDLK